MTKEEFVQNVSAAEKSLYRVAKSILKDDEDCADAIQSAILHAFDKRNTLKQEKYFCTWLIRILINECYQVLRKKQAEVSYEEYMGNAESFPAHSEVYETLMELEELYRIPFVLHYIEGYSTKEIAKILTISLSNVKIRLQRARIKLQDILKGDQL